MTYVETRMNVWEALAGRAPGEPAGPTDPGLWGAVVDRLNPARARPVLRGGIEAMQLVSVRGAEYVMLRSPDDGTRACYLRLTPDEWQLALLMDGTLHGGPAGRRVRPDRRPARPRPGPPGGRRPGRQPDARRAAGGRVPAAARDGAQPLPERVGRGLLAAARGRRCSWSTSTGWSPSCTGPAAGSSSAGPPRSCWPLVAVAGLGAVRARPGARRRVAVPDRRVVPVRCRRPAAAQRARRWSATSSATRWPPSTPAARCRPPACWSTSASRRSSSTPPTCGWPAGGPGCWPPRPGRPAGLVLAGAVAVVGLRRAGARPARRSSWPSPGT